MCKIGTQYKVVIHIDPVNDISMIDNLVSAVFFTPLCQRKIELLPKDIRRRDEENAVFIIDSMLLAPGNLFCTITARVPDEDAQSGYRIQVNTLFTGIYIEP
jgi:hypothetical protein